MAVTETELREQLAEARLRLSDLTRELDESPMVAEHEAPVQSELERIGHRIADLERQLEELAGKR